ncbi:MAG TPA: phosphoribosylanthranilate isomerase, partial [Longimicrobiaceae bacterium]|nr:phosphoribosylanthranilate isomerase [Longimicrobiaceae bacterium]
LKVCGITRRADAEAAAAEGAAYLGVVLAPGGKRTVGAEAAGELLAGLGVLRVGVFVDAGAEELRRAGEAAGLDVLQLHGDEPPELLRELRAEGRWRVWKALRPRAGDEFRSGVERYAADADALLLDGFSPGAHGGTGVRFPWEEVAALRGLLPDGVPLVAAGGMRAENVARAVALLRPDVVDVSSGVESAPGIKDPRALREFAAALRRPPHEPRR